MFGCVNKANTMILISRILNRVVNIGAIHPSTVKLRNVGWKVLHNKEGRRFVKEKKPLR